MFLLKKYKKVKNKKYECVVFQKKEAVDRIFRRRGFDTLQVVITRHALYSI